MRPRIGISNMIRLSQLLKGAVVVTLCQNEADVKCQMDIESSISLTEQAGKIRLTACSVVEIWWKFPLEILLLPHSRRGSRQLLLSMTDTFDIIIGRPNCLTYLSEELQTYQTYPRSEQLAEL